MPNLDPFHQRYPALSNFLGAWFPDADFEGLTDAQVVGQFAATGCPGLTASILQEGRRALAHEPFLWRDLGDEADRCFQSPEEGREWLPKSWML